MCARAESDPTALPQQVSPPAAGRVASRRGSRTAPCARRGAKPGGCDTSRSPPGRRGTGRRTPHPGNGVLRQARYAIVTACHVVAVPVQGHYVLDVGVAQRCETAISAVPHVRGYPIRKVTTRPASVAYPALKSATTLLAGSPLLGVRRACSSGGPAISTAASSAAASIGSPNR